MRSEDKYGNTHTAYIDDYVPQKRSDTQNNMPPVTESDLPFQRMSSKQVTAPINLQKVLDSCKERIKDYPVETVEYRKIKQQIETIEKELRK